MQRVKCFIEGKMVGRVTLLFLLLFSACFCVHAQLNTDRILSIGRNALYFEDYVLSIQYFNQVIRIKPYLVEPYYYRAVAKIQLEDYEGAEQDINAVLERNPFLAGAFYARGFVRKQTDRLAEAEADFDKALEFSPENRSVFLNRLEVRERLGKYDEALSDIDLLMKKTDDAVLLNFERGRILFMKGDTLAALRSFDELLRADSLSDEVWGMRALIRLQTGDRKGALSDYDKAIERNGRNPGYFVNRGILNYWEKNYRGALSDYDKAIELDPQSKLSLFNRALLRDEVGDYNNAVEDLNRVLRIDPDYSEALFKRALLHAEIKDWSAAERDYTDLIVRYPNFVPAYYGRSEARRQLGMAQSAYIDLEAAKRIEANKDKIKKDIDTNAKYAEEESVRDRTKEFDATGGTDLAKSKYDNNLRGTVQNRFTDVVNERNFVVSYYAVQNADGLRKAQRYYGFVGDMNRSGALPADLKITNREISLTAELINRHSSSIDSYSHAIQQNVTDPNLFFARGLDFALVQDFNSAIDDFSRAIGLDSEFSLAYFCRANIRFKQLERMANDGGDASLDETIGVAGARLKMNLDALTQERKYAYDFELIMRDYDQVIRLTPDFEYAWFNRANLLCVQKDFRTAIQNYTNALAINPDFAEAYFNRGLTRIYIGDVKAGLSDLSKSGELGIYQAYNLLKRLK